VKLSYQLIEEPLDVRNNERISAMHTKNEELPYSLSLATSSGSPQQTVNFLGTLYENKLTLVS
jgi:hypothetical protein